MDNVANLDKLKRDRKVEGEREVTKLRQVSTQKKG